MKFFELLEKYEDLFMIAFFVCFGIGLATFVIKFIEVFAFIFSVATCRN